MRKLLILWLVIFFLSSCTAIRKSSDTSSPSPKSTTETSPRFLENVSLSPERKTISSAEQEAPFNAVYIRSQAAYLLDKIEMESMNALQFKYAILLNIPIETSLNKKLLEFMDEWYGIPYRYGGSTKKGIDCSAFVTNCMSVVYGKSIPRNSKDQYEAVKKIKKKKLEEGDLVFFNTRGGISHVGMYIINNKFIHASTSSGVTISDLDDDYFVKRYVGSGRIK